MTDAAPREGWYVIYCPRPGDVVALYRGTDGNFHWRDALDMRTPDLPPGSSLGPRIDDLLRDAARLDWQHSQLFAFFPDTGEPKPDLRSLIDAEIARERGDD